MLEVSFALSIVLLDDNNPVGSGFHVFFFTFQSLHMQSVVYQRKFLTRIVLEYNTCGHNWKSTRIPATFKPSII